MKIKSICIAALLGVAIFAGQAPSPVSAENLHVVRKGASRDISVSMNRAIVVESDVPFAELSVANASIADFSTLSDRTIYLLGKAPGRTTLTLLDEAGQRLEFEPLDYGPLHGLEPGLGTIGGVVACNLAGPRRLKHGAARDHILGVHAVSGRGEMFKSGGYNVYPREVERCLEDHPAVQMASVVSIPDPVFDEVGHAFVVAAPDTGDEADDLAAILDAHCRERLANYKVPKAIHVRDELPRLAIGKVDRKALATQASASASATAGS